MPLMKIPRRIRIPIISLHVWMKAVQRVIKPKPKVIEAKKIRGPTIRTANVAGSWKQTLATVKIRIEKE